MSVDGGAIFECTCEAVGLGPCRECSPTPAPALIDLRTSRTEARPDLLAIHDRLIDAGKGFAAASLASVPHNAQVPRQRRTRRNKVVSRVVPGWALCVDESQSMIEKRIVLVETGEIFTDNGDPLLTNEFLTERHWAVAEWFTLALHRYRLSGWPSGVEDPRQLAVEFHTVASAEPPEMSDAMPVRRGKRWKAATLRWRPS